MEVDFNKMRPLKSYNFNIDYGKHNILKKSFKISTLKIIDGNMSCVTFFFVQFCRMFSVVFCQCSLQWISDYNDVFVINTKKPNFELTGGNISSQKNLRLEVVCFDSNYRSICNTFTRESIPFQSHFMKYRTSLNSSGEL